MNIYVLLSLALASFIWMAAPGPGVFATIARSIAFGFRSTVPFILGIACGDLVYILFAFFGLAMIASVLGDLFIVIRWAGGAYLIYLGIRAWRQPIAGAAAPTVAPATRSSDMRTFLGGLFLTLGNPKVIIFYLSFLPTFTDLGQLTLAGGAAIAATMLGVLISVLVGYALTAQQVRRIFRTERANRVLNRTAGTVMIGAGCAVIAKT
ncbi:MAG: LysE family translocator [Rhodospirillales bacterium]|nr:LysE family translocator [Rhodospirillales bacterium]